MSYGAGGDAPCYDEIEAPVLDAAVRLHDFQAVRKGQLGWPVAFCLGDAPALAFEVAYPGGEINTIDVGPSAFGSSAILLLNIGMPVGRYELTVRSRGAVLASQYFRVEHADEPRIFDLNDPAGRPSAPTQIGLVGFEQSATVRVAVYRSVADAFDYRFQTETLVRTNQNGEAILRIAAEGVSDCALFVATPQSLEAFHYEDGAGDSDRYSVDFSNPLVHSACWGL